MDASPAIRLTTRELQVMHALARGLTWDEVAHELGITRSTMSGHLQNIGAKVGATGTRPILYALGWMHPPDEETINLLGSAGDVASAKARAVAALRSAADQLEASGSNPTDPTAELRPLRGALSRPGDARES